jgi:hypothetical protein
MIKTQPRWPIIVLIVAALATVLGSLSPTAASAQARSFKRNVEIPLNTVVEANGQSFQVSGGLHGVLHFTQDDAGGLHAKAHLNGQGIKVVRVSDGSTFQGTGAANLTLNFGEPKGAASNATGVVNIGLIGRGRTPNLRLHANLHATVNANDEVTATVANVRVTSQ